MSIKDKKTAKELQSQLSSLTGEIDAMRVDISNKQKELGSKKNIADSIKNRIARLNNPENPKASEHAMLRYLERVKGINLKEVEKEILDADVLGMVEKLGGNGTYPSSKGFRVVMKNSVVITIKIG